MSQALSNVFKLKDIINVKDPAFGAKGDGVTNDTAAFNSVITALSDGDVAVMPAGNYILTGASLNFGTKKIHWRGHNVRINGSRNPPDEWRGFFETTNNAGTTGDSHVRTRIYDNVNSGSAFRYHTVMLHSLRSGYDGNRETLTINLEAGSHGVAGKFLVGCKASVTSASFGNLSGGNFVAEAQVGAQQATEAVGCEMNTIVKVASINRKVALQVADVDNSTGQGLISAGIAVLAQAGCAGFRQGLMFGDENGISSNPIIQGAGGNGSLIRSYLPVGQTIQFGLHLGGNFYGTAIQLTSQRTGHNIGFSAFAGSGGERGLIRSDASADTAGYFIFVNRGMALQYHDGASTRGNAIIIDGTDASNPVTMRVAGTTKKVTEGVTDSGGSGFKVLRVPN